MDDLADYSLDDALNIPMSINVSTAPSTSSSASYGRQQQSRMAPGPVRVSTPFQQIMESPPPHFAPSAGKPTPPTPAAPIGTPPRHPASSSAGASSAEKHRSPSAFLQTIEDHDHSENEIESASSFPSDLDQHAAFHNNRGNRSQNAHQPSPSPTAGVSSPHGDITAASSTLSDGPFIASMQELKKHAAQRRSRNSILMKQRFRMSGSGAGHLDGSSKHQPKPLGGAGGTAAAAAAGLATKPSEEENNIPNTASGGKSSPSLLPSSAPPSLLSAPEHMVIAIRLLRAHKAHVDHIMETLKIEMDALRDFDRLLEEPGRPSEEEVLDYFESVGLCLDQRSQAAQHLQQEMDRISRGEPPQE
jgi:hypothetical protein